MDDESDAELYGDLLPLNRTNELESKRLEEANAKLRQENDQLKQKMNEVLLEKRALALDKKKLETNFSSLLKTAQTEIKRKDLIISDLRREKDSVVFRRGRNTRYDNRHQERNEPLPYEADRPKPAEHLGAPAISTRQVNHTEVVAPKQADQTIATPQQCVVENAPAKVHLTEALPTTATVMPSPIVKTAATAAVAAIVAQINKVPQTVFSKRLAENALKTILPVKAPELKPFEVVQENKSLAVQLPPTKPTQMSTPNNPILPKKKRITPVLISDPSPKEIRISPKESDLNKFIRNITQVSCGLKPDVTTPKATVVEKTPTVTNKDAIKIPKSKIVSHVKASYDTSNAKTSDFKRRVSSNPGEIRRKTELPPPVPIPTSENSCDGMRRPSNYDLMKRNVKHKYHSLDSPKKAERSRRSRSRSVCPSDERRRDRHRRPAETERRASSRRNASPGRDGGLSKRHESSRRPSKFDGDDPRRSPRRNGSPSRRRETPTKRRPSLTYAAVKNFSPILSPSARKSSEKRSSRDRSSLEKQASATSKPQAKLDDVVEKSDAKVTSADKPDQSRTESILVTSTTKISETKTEITNEKPDVSLTVASSASSVRETVRVLAPSPSKTNDAKRKSIEAVTDSLTFKLTTQATETATGKTTAAFAALKTLVTDTKSGSGLLTFESFTSTKISDAVGDQTVTIPHRDFVHNFADYKTPENSTEMSLSKTMSPPEVPKARAGTTAPTSFSGMKHFSFPFTPMKLAIANEFMSFPSIVTPLKATPVKAEYACEDSLDLALRSQASATKDPPVGNEIIKLTPERDPHDKAQPCMNAVTPKTSETNAKSSPDGAEDKTAAAAPPNDNLEEGELSDVVDEPPTPSRPIVAAAAKKRAPRAARAAADKVVSPDTMNDLRQRLLSRNGCPVPPRKDAGDYDVRLKPAEAKPRPSATWQLWGGDDAAAKSVVEPRTEQGLSTAWQSSRRDSAGFADSAAEPGMEQGLSTAGKSSRGEASSLAKNARVPRTEQSLSTAGQSSRVEASSLAKNTTEPRTDQDPYASWRSSGGLAKAAEEPRPPAARQPNRSRSPAACFLQKSPDRTGLRGSRGDRGSPHCGESRRRSDGRGRRSGSRSHSPRPRRRSPARSRSPRLGARRRGDASTGHSASRSPKPAAPPRNRSPRLASIDESRGRSPAKRPGRSKSKSPAAVDGVAKVDDWLRSNAETKRHEEKVERLGEGAKEPPTPPAADCDEAEAGTKKPADSRVTATVPPVSACGLRIEVVPADAPILENDKCVYVGPAANLPDILSTLGSGRPPPQAGDNPFRKRRRARVIAQGTLLPSPANSPPKPAPSVGGGNAGTTSQLTPCHSVKPLEAVKQLEAVMQLETVKPFEPVKQLEALKPFEPVKQLVAVKPLEPVKQLEAVKPFEPVKQLEAVKPLEPVKQLETVKPFEPVKQLEAVKPFEPVKQLEAVKPFESVNQFKPVRQEISAETTAVSLSDLAATEDKPTSNGRPAVSGSPKVAPPTADANNFFRKRRRGRVIAQGTLSAIPVSSPPKASESVGSSVASTPSSEPEKPHEPVRPETRVEAASVPLVGPGATVAKALSNGHPVVSAPADASGFPFRRRGRVRMLPPNPTSTPRPIPVPEPAVKAAATTPDHRPSASEKAPVNRSASSISDKSVDLSVSPKCGMKRKLNSSGASERSGATASAKKPKKVVDLMGELLRRKKSLFGSDTDGDEGTEGRSKRRCESSDGGSSDSDSPCTEDGGERSSIWPEKPAEPRRRTAVFLEELPATERIIKQLLTQASRSISGKKKKLAGSGKACKLLSKAPKSAEYVETDDSD